MNRGKDICKELKAVRRRIAEENNIPLEIPECTHQGPCPGTCPHCEAEVRYLENALADRLRMGKVATVAGLALTLATGVNAQAQQPVQQDTVRTEAHQVVNQSQLHGTVIDEKTKEPLPFVNILVKQDNKLITGTSTDFDGHFTIELPKGKYTLEVSYIGYARLEQQVTVDGKTDIELQLWATATILGMPATEIMAGIFDRYPIFEMGDGATNNEQEGINLRVQY